MIYLTHPQLGRVDLDPFPDGYVPVGLQIGWPDVAEVVYDRALADGVDDRTRFLRQRALTVSVRLDQRLFPTQTLIDRVTPFLLPRYRPEFVYSLAPDPLPSHVRRFTVRGVDAPIQIDGPKYQALVMQWVTTDARSTLIEGHCELVRPGSEGEEGRTYDLTFDRVYPPSLPSGAKVIVNAGNTGADWIATITADIDDPVLIINGVRIEFTGLSLVDPAFVVIDTLNRTMFRNNDPTDSVYNLSNFAEWDWDDLLLQPGENIVRFQGDEPSATAGATICWDDTFA